MIKKNENQLEKFLEKSGILGADNFYSERIKKELAFLSGRRMTQEERYSLLRLVEAVAFVCVGQDGTIAYYREVDNVKKAVAEANNSKTS